MRDSEKRRFGIFNRYSKHLQLVINEGLIPDLNLHFDETYICPICLQQFSRFSLVQSLSNPLTLEDVPPLSLGGRSNILTCKSCNNFCGTTFDYQLTDCLIQSDNAKFKPNSEFIVLVSDGGKELEAKVKVKEDGTMSMFHEVKKSNPYLLPKFIESVKPNKPINFRLKGKNIEKKKVEIAMLKVAYLLMFEKYGYTFLFNSVYDSLRKQLLNPDKDIYPLDLWFTPQFPNEVVGVPFIIDSDKKSILAIFYLHTGISSTQFALAIPFPDTDIRESYNNLRKESKNKGTFDLQMYAIPEDVDILFDLHHIQKVIGWILSK